MKKFSILIPTRGRPESLKRTIKSIISTTQNIEDIEILVVYDRDDKETELTLIDLLINYKLTVISRNRSPYLNGDYYNYLASYSTSKYLVTGADDLIFKTQNWDSILEEAIEKYLLDKPDRLAYIDIEDGTTAQHCCFPIITIECYNALGMMFHPEIKTWGADRTLAEVFQGIDRILQVPISIDHLSYHDNKAPFDTTAQSVKSRFFENCNIHNEVSATIVPKQIEYLKTYIKKVHDERMA